MNVERIGSGIIPLWQLEPCKTCPYFVPVAGMKPDAKGVVTGRCHRNPPSAVQIMVAPSVIERGPPAPAWQGIYPPAQSEGEGSGCGDHPLELEKRERLCEGEHPIRDAIEHE